MYSQSRTCCQSLGFLVFFTPTAGYIYREASLCKYYAFSYNLPLFITVYDHSSCFMIIQKALYNNNNNYECFTEEVTEFNSTYKDLIYFL